MQPLWSIETAREAMIIGATAMLFSARMSRSLLILLLMVAVLCGVWQAATTGDTADVSEPLVRVTNRSVPQVNKCAACHSDVCEQFSDAPHSRTLTRAETPEIMNRFAGRSFQFSDGGPVVSFVRKDRQLWMTSNEYPDFLKIEWMFGSGQHAMTPVSLLVNPDGGNELIEGSVSWYPPDILGPTPGAEVTGAPGVRSLGIHLDNSTTLECFGCHVTLLPHRQGRILQDALHTGVSCDRCHPGGERHIQAMNSGGVSEMASWSSLSPLESVNRCGECHRRADQLTAEELLPSRTVLVRFASVGLAMSACFLQQETLSDSSRSQSKFRMDCLTCHDPHQRAETSATYYTAKCMVCHQSSAGLAADCSSSLTSDACLSCHMPAVNVTDNLQLTDHWIRVRNSNDPPAAGP